MKRISLISLTVLFVSLFANAQTYKFSTLYSFPKGGDGPSNIGASLIVDSDGNLYGVSTNGGQYRRGTIFRVSPTGTLSVLYNFKGSPDGFGPTASLFRDSAGNLYGTTSAGGKLGGCGPEPSGCGTVFKLTSAGKETVLYRFTGLTDGGLPNIGVTADSAGNVYGATLNEVQAGGDAGNGDVYKIDPTGTFTILHSFCFTDPNCGDGQYPVSAPILDASGNLYGGTASGGQYGGGTIYQISPSGVESVLYSFASEYESLMWGNLTRDGQGDFYGVTVAESFNDADGGKIFKVTSSGSETVPYTFCVTPPGCPAGDEPEGPIQIDKSGNLYGVVTQGGANGSGGVFKVNTKGAEEIIHSFPAGFRSYGVVMDAAGNLYGISANGGTYNAGEVYKLTLQN
jgi:uncharacterized repeat protein (TIGR03803 family)